MRSSAAFNFPVSRHTKTDVQAQFEPPEEKTWSASILLFKWLGIMKVDLVDGRELSIESEMRAVQTVLI